MIWTPFERDLLGEQVIAVLPAPGLEASFEEGLPALLEAMPPLPRFGLRAAVWWTALRARRVGPETALRSMEGGSWLAREAAVLIKAVAGLLWERARLPGADR